MKWLKKFLKQVGNKVGTAISNMGPFTRTVAYGGLAIGAGVIVGGVIAGLSAGGVITIPFAPLIALGAGLGAAAVVTAASALGEGIHYFRNRKQASEKKVLQSRLDSLKKNKASVDAKLASAEKKYEKAKEKNEELGKKYKEEKKQGKEAQNKYNKLHQEYEDLKNKQEDEDEEAEYGQYSSHGP
jgi:hypothetical protein